jgi:4-alpha-glucanotransferase
MTRLTTTPGDRRRRAGLLIPLFSCASSESWGIGDIGDIAPVAAWLCSAGQRVLQLLPINEMAPGERSPYSALSAMAIDPIFIRVTDIPDAAALAGTLLDADDRALLERVRGTPTVDYSGVRAIKERALARSFEQFRATDWERQTARARELAAFGAREAWWLDDYALFRALHEREHPRQWTDWPEPLRRRDPSALATARIELGSEVLFQQYLQWIADEQWQAARRTARSHGVEVFGDLPFMVDRDSADVWAHQDSFHLDGSVGVPPDAFSATGQDWGMPPYRWDRLAALDFRWLRDRARRSAALYDGYRVDHVVGFYRTYWRPRGGGAPRFEPSDEPEQLELGERVLSIFREPGTEIVAEDLGTVPEFVRESLARLGVPGCRVLRWERHWHTDGQPFRDPSEYPETSVAVSGTHDTEPLVAWWEHMSLEEKKKVSALPTVRRANGGQNLSAEYLPSVRDALLESLFASRSYLLLIPVQDVFGWRDRINEPATIKAENWTFKLAWPSDRLGDEAEAIERRDALRRWAQKYERL